MGELALQIEKLREALYQTVKVKGLRHPDVLHASQFLDQAITRYQRQKGRECSPRIQGK